MGLYQVDIPTTYSVSTQSTYPGGYHSDSEVLRGLNLCLMRLTGRGLAADFHSGYASELFSAS